MNCQLLIRGACSIALTGLSLASIPAASASTPHAESEDVAFCRVFHYGQDSDLTLPAAKAAGEAEDSRTVRMIYFRPKDRPFRAEVVDSMKVAILQIQAFFGQEMQRHGYGKLTFRFETDDKGKPLVHRVVGEHADEHYLEKFGATAGEIWRALGRTPIEIIVLDLSADTVPTLNGPAAGVTWTRWQGDRRVGTVLVPSSFSFKLVAHELGHAFGLDHDFRDSDYIMSYGEPDQARLSACAAGYLAVNPYLNPGIGLVQEVSPSFIELLSPPGYPAGSRSTSVRLKISGSSGLHQVLLFARTEPPHFAGGLPEVKACRTLSGERKAIVEFDYDGLIPSSTFSSLADPIVHRMSLWAVDTSGRTSRHFFSLYQLSEHHVASLQEIGTVKSLAFSPGGAALASAAGDSLIRLWHLGKRKIIASFGPAPPVWAVGISPDGATLASEHNGTVRLWDLSTGTHTATLKGRPGDPSYSAVAFSPVDGATLAVVSGDRTVSLWDLATGANYVCHLKHDSPVTSVAFSPDGERLASASEDGTVHLWDPATGERTAVWEGHWGWVGAVAFSPDAATLASQSGWDGLVKLWDVKTQGIIATMANTVLRGGSSMAFSPDGATLACASGEQVILWDVGTRTQIESLTHGNWVEVVAFSPDGKTLAYGTLKAVELWDASEWLKPRPHELVKISGDGQEGPPGTSLKSPLVVEVRDQRGNVIGGAPVTFAVTDGDGRLSGRFTAVNTETDADGRAVALITHGTNPGTTTVEARLLRSDPVTFSVVTVEAPVPPTADGDHRKWHLPDGATVRLGKGIIAAAQGSGDVPVAFSPDGKRLAVATSIGIWLYDAATARELDLLTGEWATAAAFSPDGAILAAGTPWGTVVLWDVASGDTTLYRHDGEVHSVAFSPDSTVLAAGSWSSVKLWNLTTGENTATLGGEGRSVAFSPDGTILAALSGGSVKLWDVAAAAIAATIDDGTEIQSVAISPDGKTLATGSSSTVKLWNAATGQETAILPGHGGSITSVAFSSDGATLAAGSRHKRVWLWDVATEKNVASFDHPDPVLSVAFSPDGATLASTSWKDILLWDLAAKSSSHIQGHTHEVNSVALSPGGGTLAIGSDMTGLWDIRTGRDTATLESTTWVNSVTFSPDGSILAVGADSLTLWDAAEGQRIATLEALSIQSLAFSPDGATLAAGNTDGIELWDVDKLQGFATLEGHTSLVTSMAFSADGAILASGSWDNTARLWEVATRQEIASLQHQGAVSVAFSPDDSVLLATGSRLGGVRLWDVDDTRKEIATLEYGFAISVAFSPDGSTLAAGFQDGTVMLWDAETRRRVATLEGHTADIRSLAFSPDGGTLASGSRDGTVLLWDLTKKPHASRIVSGDGQEGLPDELQLHQNAPNPFNSETVITWFLLQPGPARLEVFALNGQRVAVLSSGHHRAGRHRLNWNGRDDQGRPLASGIYLYRLVTAEEILARKFALIR